MIDIFMLVMVIVLAIIIVIVNIYLLKKRNLFLKLLKLTLYKKETKKQLQYLMQMELKVLFIMLQ